MEDTNAAAELERFFFDTPADGRRECCVEALPLPDGRTAFVIEDVSAGTGRSVVSVTKTVAMEVCRRHGVAPARRRARLRLTRAAHAPTDTAHQGRDCHAEVLRSICVARAKGADASEYLSMTIIGKATGL